MDFLAKFNGPPPPTQDYRLRFNDCDTNQPTPDGPTTLSVTPVQSWITTAQFIPPDIVRVGVNQDKMAVGVYPGTVNAKIPDTETCEVGKLLPIPVTMTIKKGNVKFG